MALSPKTIRSQMALLKPLLKSCSLETMRKGQDLVGELMGAAKAGRFVLKEHKFPDFTGFWVTPKDERRQGVILYLHGGGYTCGSTDYAKGFGITLAERFGVKVFCPGYRLAPEHPFPAALEDALTAYRYLLDKGYAPSHIALCGESAGGGLCYSLCLKLRELEMEQPSCIIGISPWVDLTLGGASYQENQESDPSLTNEFLEYCVKCYAENREDPMISPVFAKLSEMPPSLIFAAKNELLLSDAQDLHRKLTEHGSQSRLIVKPDRWHAYVVYGIKEDQDDFNEINRFLNRYLSQEKKLRWMRLDNAAKIYPAARNQNWSNVFRLSATLTEEIDRDVMQSALDVTVRRFPSIAARLRRGVFWYYLQQLEQAPTIRQEVSYPLTKMSKKEARQCALRVIVYKSRVAVEFFHSLTDGTGGMVFLKTLVAEYLQQKYGLSIPAEAGVLGRLEEPSDGELEDSFQKYAGPVNASRKEDDAWRLMGTPEQDGYLNLICFELSSPEVLQKAHEYGVTVTAFLCAVMMQALQQLQKKQVPNIRRRKAIKVQLPINLRKIFPSSSLRNFALYTTPQIDPRLGEYDFADICKTVHHWMGLEITPRKMAMMIAANVNSERLWIVKIMPLFIKNMVMKAVFKAVGERKSCLSLSNLGAVQLPEVMTEYVQRLDFILGVQATAPYNCGVVSFKDSLYINFIRNTREPQLEEAFFKVLQELGIAVQVSSNGKGG
ncbi:MAG: alpha/beta hydrolase fold domain-containing protein [Oscillospiraceae bacterium]|nr:alpha/beta hydrolase fold domain-containing protein [Oscillospiraceae bacterium]